METQPVRMHRTETFRMKSEIVGDEFQIFVQLPFSYSQTEQTYPTLYATDGDDSFTLISSLLHMALLEGSLPEMILVAIGYGTDLLDPANRRDFDLPTTKSAWPKMPGMEGEPPTAGGGGENFLRFIREELIPHIEKTYRADPSNRAYSGVSFGGIFGAFALFTHPETFSKYILSSPALWWDERVTFTYEEQYAKAHTDLSARVFLSIGTEEAPPEFDQFFHAVDNVIEFEKQLIGRKYPSLQLKFNHEEGGHTTSQPGALMKGLKYIFAREDDN